MVLGKAVVIAGGLLVLFVAVWVLRKAGGRQEKPRYGAHLKDNMAKMRRNAPFKRRGPRR